MRSDRCAAMRGDRKVARLSSRFGSACDPFQRKGGSTRAPLRTWRLFTGPECGRVPDRRSCLCAWRLGKCTPVVGPRPTRDRSQRRARGRSVTWHNPGRGRTVGRHTDGSGAMMVPNDGGKPPAGTAGPEDCPDPNEGQLASSHFAIGEPVRIFSPSRFEGESQPSSALPPCTCVRSANLRAAAGSISPPIICVGQ
jgi:hypothetical protein